MQRQGSEQLRPASGEVELTFDEIEKALADEAVARAEEAVALAVRAYVRRAAGLVGEGVILCHDDHLRGPR